MAHFWLSVNFLLCKTSMVLSIFRYRVCLAMLWISYPFLCNLLITFDSYINFYYGSNSYKVNHVLIPVNFRQIHHKTHHSFFDFFSSKQKLPKHINCCHGKDKPFIKIHGAPSYSYNELFLLVPDSDSACRSGKREKVTSVSKPSSTPTHTKHSTGHHSSPTTKKIKSPPIPKLCKQHIKSIQQKRMCLLCQRKGTVSTNTMITTIKITMMQGMMMTTANNENNDDKISKP